MVRIDQLIHSFHGSLGTGKATRPFASHLIESSHHQVVEFLVRLSARDDGVDKEQWRARSHGMYETRRAQELRKDNPL